MIAIRRGCDRDGPALAQLIAGVFREYDNCPFVTDEFPELAAPARHFEGRGGALFVATYRDAVIGSLAVVPSWRADEFTLAKVYLAAEWRGQGIAATLLAHGEGFAVAGGGRALSLWSDTRFVRGHGFYRKQGFRQEAGIRQLHDAGASVEFRFSRPIRPNTR